MNKLTYILSVISFIFLGNAYAQTNQHPSGYHKCGTEESWTDDVNADPANAAKREAFNELVRSTLQQGVSSNRSEKRIIPVVFHIIHEGGSENISKEQVLDQVRILNEDFARTNADFGSTPAPFAAVAANTNIEFRLATKDDQGNCTDGIVRVFSAKTNGANNANGVKNISRWNSTKYLNVWVVRSIGDLGDIQGTILGYAQFPFGGLLSTDGIVVRHDCIGSVGTAGPGGGGMFGARKGRTATHEVGHWLGLRHVWGDADCGSDGVDDTPIAQAPNYGICFSNFPHKVGACASAEDNPNGEMFVNYMDYSDDQCMTMFSEGQSEIMNLVLDGFRSYLVSDENLAATGTRDEDIANPITCVPIANFSQNFNMVCTGNPVSYTDISFNASNYDRAWQFEGGTPSSSSSATQSVNYASPGRFNTSITVSNGAGQDALTKNSSIVVSENVGQYEGPYSENFSDDGRFNSDYIVQTEDNNRWMRRATNGINNSECLMLDNINNSPSSIDAFITPSFKANSISSPSLAFEIAYAERGGTPNDILRIYASTNCGRTWGSPIVTYSAAQMFSAGLYTNNFTPTSNNQYKLLVRSLSTTLANNANVRFKFEFTSGTTRGNNIFIDNINIGTALGLEDLSDRIGLNVFPNPTGALSQLTFDIEKPSQLSISIFDILGKRIANTYSGNIGSGQHLFNVDLSAYPAGLYTIRVEVDGLVAHKKLVKN
jgi:PKD repeat protein